VSSRPFRANRSIEYFPGLKPWVSQKNVLALKGQDLEMRTLSIGSGFSPYRTAPSGLIPVRDQTQGEPWAKLSWPLRATDRRGPNCRSLRDEESSQTALNFVSFSPGVRTGYDRNLIVGLLGTTPRPEGEGKRVGVLTMGRMGVLSHRCFAHAPTRRYVSPTPLRRSAEYVSPPPHRIKMTVRFLGPWAPKTRIRSMSPVRLGPVMKVMKLG
jgi:hypothetical protein